MICVLACKTNRVDAGLHIFGPVYSNFVLFHTARFSSGRDEIAATQAAKQLHNELLYRRIRNTESQRLLTVQPAKYYRSMWRNLGWKEYDRKICLWRCE